MTAMTTATERLDAITARLEGIEARAKAYAEHGTPGLAAPQDRAFLLDIARKQAAALEAVRVIERRLERSMQGEDREIAGDLRTALEATP